MYQALRLVQITHAHKARIVEHRRPGLLIGWFGPGGAPADVYGRPPQETASHPRGDGFSGCEPEHGGRVLGV